MAVIWLYRRDGLIKIMAPRKSSPAQKKLASGAWWPSGGKAAAWAGLGEGV